MQNGNSILQRIAEVANRILNQNTLHADFKRLADLIKDIKNPSMKKDFAQRVMDTEKNNPRFNKNLFLQACGLQASAPASSSAKQNQPKTVDGWTLDDILRREG